VHCLNIYIIYVLLFLFSICNELQLRYHTKTSTQNDISLSIYQLINIYDINHIDIFEQNINIIIGVDIERAFLR
jgi:hypothetical protein